MLKREAVDYGGSYILITIGPLMEVNMGKNTCLLAILFTISIASPSYAQNWTAEQQGVIDDLEACWDLWVEALDDRTPDAWASACAEEDYTYWFRGAALGGLEDLRREWSMIRETQEYWIGLHPISIKIYGDIAIMHFVGIWSGLGPEGRIINEANRTEVYRRDGGQWKIVAGHNQATNDRYY